MSSKKLFFQAGELTGIKILKQYRGNGGEGVFKVDTSGINKNIIKVTHAKGDNTALEMSVDNFFEEMKFYFTGGGMLIEQPWNPNIINGMVRCYMTGTKVTGFGYQEINALYPLPDADGRPKLPGRRYYYSENCGLFSDLKQMLETRWINQLMETTGLPPEMMPVIWDADFFIIQSTQKIQRKNIHAARSM